LQRDGKLAASFYDMRKGAEWETQRA
jgi:hypothetical protein